MNKHTKSKKPSAEQQRQAIARDGIFKPIRQNRLVIALDKYFDFQEVSSNVQVPGVGGPYDYDFMVWPSWHYVKIFANLDYGEVQKYAQHVEPNGITFIVDIDTPQTGLAHIEVGRIVRCTLVQDAFRAAQTLKAYVYFQRRIWTSHMGMNLWEPLLPMEHRILHARDWELTQPAPATVMTKKS